MEPRATTSPLIPKFCIRFGFLLGLLCNLVLIVKALPYLSIPIGALIYADSAYSDLYGKLLLVSVFGGIPLSIWDARRARKGRFNAAITTVAIVLCCLTFFTPFCLEKYIGNARQIRTHCYPCDGSQDYIDGLYLTN